MGSVDPGDTIWDLKAWAKSRIAFCEEVLRGPTNPETFYSRRQEQRTLTTVLNMLRAGDL